MLIAVSVIVNLRNHQKRLRGGEGTKVIDRLRKHMGTYRYLMFLFCVSEIIYSTAHIVIMPEMHVHGRGFVLMPSSFLKNTMTPAHWGSVFYGSLFCQSLVLLSFHFVYRYFLICKNQWLYLYNLWKYVPIHFGIWLLAGLIWGSVLHIYMYHNDTLMNYFRDALWEEYGFDVNKTAILGPLYKHPDENGVETAAMSESSRKLQVQLFRALLVQTAIPIVLEYIPCAVTFLSPLFAIPRNTISHSSVNGDTSELQTSQVHSTQAAQISDIHLTQKDNPKAKS
ncbi:unnamed protein product, partial [Mesorhabditis belari]|uniref:Uncharacterized protein n=1 Tax=Mesorhabditis belari TaxID=2138241 RepID=A0AAF3F518_9BILA